MIYFMKKNSKDPDMIEFYCNHVIGTKVTTRLAFIIHCDDLDENVKLTYDRANDGSIPTSIDVYFKAVKE